MKENSIMKSRKIIFTTILSALVCFGLCQQVQSATDTPDPGSVSLSNTADGQNALLSLTSGIYNSAFGFDSLLLTSDASFNTGVGAGTLLLNIASQNTAVGAGALLSNSDGADNNAVGAFALFTNVSGSFNNAVGRGAQQNSTGDQNNALGDLAMFNNTTGSLNTAVGDDALFNCVDGSNNVAIGDEAGTSIVSSSNMIAIGVTGAGPFADISNTCFIGSIYNQPVSDAGTAQDTYVDQFNVLGFLPSSQRFKHDIQPMDKASEAILALRPVTFKYNSDKKGTTQYGLIAEEVAKVAPDLVFRGKDGEINTVRFEQIGAMLLNEFLKEHKKVQSLEAIVAQQQKGMEILTAQLKKQAAQIQQVSAQLEVSKPAPQVVATKP
jgi:Chaperone of endosialidase